MEDVRRSETITIPVSPFERAFLIQEAARRAEAGERLSVAATVRELISERMREAQPAEGDSL